MIRLAIALLISGAVLTYFGVQEVQLAAGARAAPQRISCAALAASGPGDNAHILLTDFRLLPQVAVLQGVNHTEKLLIPAVPGTSEADGSAPATAPSNVAVLVMTRGVHSKEQFAEFAARTTIDGMILNKIDSLGSKERAALAADLPGADLDKLWLLEQGRLPESMAHAAAMLGVGVTILLGGGALAIRRLDFARRFDVPYGKPSVGRFRLRPRVESPPAAQRAKQGVRVDGRE